MHTVQQIEVEKLKLNEKNPRRIDAPAFERLCQSLLEDPEYFQMRPIISNKDLVVICGNQRLKAARKIGLKLVPVCITDQSELDIKRMLRDNILEAKWVYGMLNDDYDIDFLKELFDDDELVKIGEANIGLDDEDDDIIPPKPQVAVTKPGDLWLLGNHRLLCGDSAKPDDVDQLLNGQKVHLVNTDPPYGVCVEPRSQNGIAAAIAAEGMKHHQSFDVSRQRKKAFVRGRNMAGMRRKSASGIVLRPKDRPLINDFVSEEKFAELLLAWFSNLSRVLEPGRCFYIWGGYANLANYPLAMKANELYFSQAIVWVKEHPVLTRKDFMGNFELCFYGWREGAAHKFFGPNNATDVWPIKKVAPQNMIHLTEKCVELAARAISYSSLKGENVLDLFGGSGSTLIACEKAARKAFLMELDPLYCDVICKRYEMMTGTKSVLSTER